MQLTQKETSILKDLKDVLFNITMNTRC